jgi:uncharacterized protein (DUF1778 family)
MTKKLTLQVDEPLHDQLTGAASRQGQSLHSWMLSALSHELFRQLTVESAEWCAAHPEAAHRQVDAHAALAQERGW